MAESISYDNYIIAHHLGSTTRGEIFRIPLYPENVDDAINSKFVETAILSRSAPIQAYASSGPRKVSFTLEVHRDLDYDEYGRCKVGDIGKLMDYYQALCLPNYSTPQTIRPPKITVKIGNKIRVTGIPNIELTKKLPLDAKGDYQVGTFSISVTELDPYGATDIYGSSISSSLGNARGQVARSSYSNYNSNIESLFRLGSSVVKIFKGWLK